MEVKSLVITGYGINCEEEVAAAYRLAGAIPEIVHLNDIFSGKVDIHSFHIINFPGGFSFGDDIASGKVLANKIKFQKLPDNSTLLDQLKKVLAEKKYILGICNGFQVLTRLGLLPNISGKFEQEVSLAHNIQGKFIDEWVTLKVPNAATPFIADMDTVELPIRHGEGRLIVLDEKIKHAVIDEKLNCLIYANNPNGSMLDCAGLTDRTGQVFGLMPHPEAFLSVYNHPDWGRRKKQGTINENGDGLKIFKNIVEAIPKNPL